MDSIVFSQMGQLKQNISLIGVSSFDLGLQFRETETQEDQVTSSRVIHEVKGWTAIQIVKYAVFYSSAFIIRPHCLTQYACNIAIVSKWLACLWAYYIILKWCIMTSEIKSTMHHQLLCTSSFWHWKKKKYNKNTNNKIWIWKTDCLLVIGTNWSN